MYMIKNFFLHSAWVIGHRSRLILTGSSAHLHPLHLVSSAKAANAWIATNNWPSGASAPLS